MHGPYWYRYEWDANSHKKRTVYVGWVRSGTC